MAEMRSVGFGYEPVVHLHSLTSMGEFAYGKGSTEESGGVL